jgi:hypothetical protein
MSIVVSAPVIIALFAWLVSHQPAVLFSHNKSATSQQYSSLGTNQPSATVTQPSALTTDMLAHEKAGDYLA